jgi:hypothetical protein
MIASKSFLPVEVVFHPSWWHRHYGMTFQQEFFFDPIKRVECELAMRAALYARFGDIGLGEADATARPVIGPVNLAAGWLPSGVLGCEIRYYDHASPEVIAANLNDEQIMALEVPDLETNPLFSKLIAMMNALEKQYGFLEGDVNWEGLQNVALNLRLAAFADYYENLRSHATCSMSLQRR